MTTRNQFAKIELLEKKPELAKHFTGIEWMKLWADYKCN